MKPITKNTNNTIKLVITLARTCATAGDKNNSEPNKSDLTGRIKFA